MSDETVAVIICTRNRPAELANALASLERSTYPVAQAIVSDDSTDDRTAQAMRERSGPVPLDYTPGPRRGLGANRNHALGLVRTDRVLFIDDDAELGETYLENAIDALSEVAPERRARTIVTGIETQYGEPVEPKEQDFLGFQRVPYDGSRPMRTVVINSTLFPAGLFREVRFDEQLVYGCDEVDFTTRACRAGYGIVLRRDAVNRHYPSKVNRDFYNRYTNASRLYATFKRYRTTERSPRRALLYAIVAPAHLLLHAVRREGVKGIGRALQTLGIAAGYITKHARSRPRPGEVAATPQ